MRANWTLNDNVGMVYFAEVDTTWGENNKAALARAASRTASTGGADGVNVETKQAFLDLKFGDTAAILGIIPVADAFESIIANDDMAGVQVTHKMGDTSFKLVYSKWDEDDSDDTELTGRSCQWEQQRAFRLGRLRLLCRRSRPQVQRQLQSRRRRLLDGQQHQRQRGTATAINALTTTSDLLLRPEWRSQVRRQLHRQRFRGGAGWRSRLLQPYSSATADRKKIRTSPGWPPASRAP